MRLAMAVMAQAKWHYAYIRVLVLLFGSTGYNLRGNIMTDKRLGINKQRYIKWR